MPDLVVGGRAIALGEVREVDLEIARLPTRTPMSLPVRVIRGRQEGPAIWLSAAIHGDELNGIEIVRRVIEAVDPTSLRGSILATPIVNLHGFLSRNRYLPDGRDLNRSFPGSPRGSLASRLAHIFMREVVSRCSVGIDLHTGSGHRTNLPQIRADLSDPETLACAHAFDAPVALDAQLRDGSLRAAAKRRGVKVLLFEGGEALRFDDEVVDTGVAGVQRVMSHLGMIDLPQQAERTGLVLHKSSWVRATHSGLLRTSVRLGDRVRKAQLLGEVSDAFCDSRFKIKASAAGVIIGRALNPVVHQGDAVFHIGHAT